MDVIFLGGDGSRRIYRWLCDREGVSVRAYLTEVDQLDLVTEIEPEFVVSVGFDHIVPADVLAVPPRGCINVHPGYLPWNRGWGAPTWSIVNDVPAGVTIHYMDEGVDTGPIISREQVPVYLSDTGQTLHDRLVDAQYDLFVDTWPAIEKETTDPTPQGKDGTHHTLTDYRDLCALDPSETLRAAAFVDRLRAVNYESHQTAHITRDGKRYYLKLDVTSAHDDAS